MAAGNILLQANDSKVANIIFEDGASGNMSVTVPKEGGTLANEAYVTSAISTIPVIPSASQTAQGIIEIATVAEVQTGTDTTRAVTPAGFAAGSLGVNQTWQDVSLSRAYGTIYTNTTGKPIIVIMGSTGFAGTGQGYLYVDSKLVCVVTSVSGVTYAPRMSVVVPNNSTYQCVQGWMASTLVAFELR